MLGHKPNPRGATRSVLLVVSILTLLASVGTSEASAYYSLTMDSQATISSPEVILQNGTAGTNIIYTNSTSAKVSVEAPLFDYVDSNEYDVDSSADKGTHFNFPAQQIGPDSTYDMLEEENTEAIEDHVDEISNLDSSQDVGTHSSFNNMKSRDSTYDILTESAPVGNEYSIDLTGGYVTVSTADISIAQGTISFWIQFDDVATGRPVGANGDLELRLDTGNVITFDWGGDITMSSSNTFTTATWYFFAFTWDENADDLFFYVGTETSTPTQDVNSQDGTYTETVSTIPQATVYWGNGYGASQPVNGHMDDIRFYNTVRTLSEILTDYNQTLNGNETGLVNYYELENDYADSAGSDDGSLSGSGAFNTDVPSWEGGDDYDLDLEVQFTNVIDFLSTEKLCIYTGALSDEDLIVDYWNGTGWENLAADLNAYSCNEYTVSLNSTTFTIRFKGGNETGDTTQDQWQIDASSLRVEGAGSKEDAVDNDASDVDSSDNLGDLVNFDNMKTFDSTYANLTESAPVGDITYINEAEASATSGTSAQVNKPTGTAEDDFMIALLVSTIASDTDGSTMFSAPSGWTNEYDYTQSAISGQHVYIYWKVAGASEPSSYTWTWTSSCGWVAQIITFRGVDTASPIHVEGTVNQESSSSPMSPSVTTNEDNVMIWLYDMSDGSAVPAGGGAPGGTTWIDQTEVASPGNGLGISTAYFVQASAGATGNQDWTLDATEENSGQQYALKPAPVCQLDLEIQWTNIPYLLPNENLSIYGGTMGTEDIKVDVWNRTGWETVFTDLSSGWNNLSITDWLTTSNFTIRFKGGNETEDTTQDTWQIDVALIHIWHEGGESYQLDLEVQWTSADYTRTNEELCIKTGAFSGSEDLQVKVRSGDSWFWVMNLTANQWNNMSITSYLTSNTFTVQFLGGTETGDTTEDSWDIDVSLLHVWTGETTWLSGWDKRVKITIDHNDVDSALSNFPVLAYLSNSSSGRNNDDVSFVFDEVGSDSKKIAVTKSDGTTQCYVEIEKWDNAGEQAWLWVKVPSISNTSDTDLYLYYDKDHADNTVYVGAPNSTPAENVWDANFKGVWHMKEVNATDSTSNSNDGTESGGVTYTDSGKIDGADDFDGTDGYIDLPDGFVQNADDFTFAAWIYWDGPAGEDWQRIFDFGTGTTVNMFLTPNNGGTDTPRFAITTGGAGSEQQITGPSAFSTGTWYHIAVTIDDATTTGILYIDGVNVSSNTGITLSPSDLGNTNQNWFGRSQYGADPYFDGVIDEARISNTSRTAAWIKASYESGRDDLLDFASEEGEGTGEGTSDGTYDYVLRVNNTATQSCQIRLRRYSDSNINRFKNCTIYFHNSTDGTLVQIYIQNGIYANQTGPWYDLGDSETIYIAITVGASSLGTSYIHTYLEILTPNTSTYIRYITTFEIS